MLGIHKLTISDHQCSYFIERPFGNYLIFSDKLENIQSDFFRSKGGIYKQFIENVDELQPTQAKLFQEFGSYGVGLFEGEKFHEYLPLESYGATYADPLVKFVEQDHGKLVYFAQKNSRVIIFGKDFYLTESGEILLHRKALNDYFVKTIQLYQPHFLFFTSFADSSHLKLK